MKRGFGSDNHSGVDSEVLDAIVNVNKEHALAYGDDEYCQEAEMLIRIAFGASNAGVYFVFNGTGANVLNIDAMCRSHEAVVCAETAHINVDECGAPQRIVGCRLLTVDTPDGKLTPDLVKTRLHGFGFEHHSQPKAISISQPTELGTLYTLDEIKALARLAHDYGMCSFGAMTTECGVDCVSFGGTKNGLLMGESAVILNPDLNKELKYRRKQMGQLYSKMRFVAAQFMAYLERGVWKRNAEHSNRMAGKLYAAVKDLKGVKVMYKVEANSVFVQLPHEVWTALQKEYFFYDWDESQNVVRWMCSFDTTEADIEAFVGALRRLLA